MRSTTLHRTSILLLLPSATSSFRSHHRSTHDFLPSTRRTSTPVTATWNARHNDSWLLDDDDDNHKTPPSTEQQLPPFTDDDTRTYFATCIPGLHAALASELSSLGAHAIQPAGTSGVSFRGPPLLGLRCVLWCRTAHTVMELVVSGGADDDGIRTADELYRFVRRAVHAPSLLGNGRGGLLTLSVGTIYVSRVPRELCHGHYTALTVKNALVDVVRELREDGERPDVDVGDADVPLVVVLRGRRADGRRGRRRREEEETKLEGEEEELVADVDIYRRLHSGGSLHRRGYRSDAFGLERDDDDRRENDSNLESWDRATRRPRRNPHPTQGSTNNTPIHRAAMKESLAAGLLLHSGWDKLIHAARSDGRGAVFIDPMTGSGTFPVEAALIACDVAPGLLRMASWKNSAGSEVGRNPHRYPPAVRWKDFCEAREWEELLADAARRAKSGVEWAKRSNVSILCNEKNPRAVELARISIQNSGVGSIISIHERDCVDWRLKEDAVIEGRTIFACNPPWGVRLTEDIDESWVSLREFLRREGNGAEAWVLSGNKDLTKILRMKKSRSVVVRTAEEDLRWLQYHIFQKSEAPVV